MITMPPGTDLREELRLLTDTKSYHYKSKNGKSYCPVVRRGGKPGAFPECGFVMAVGGLMDPTVYAGSLFEHFEAKLVKKSDIGGVATFHLEPNLAVPDFPLPQRRLEYVSTLAMLEAGWVVD